MTWSGIGPLALRLALGLILVVHGWPKFAHLRRTEDDMEVMGFKPGKLWGTLVALVEFVGGLMLIAGFLTPVVAALVVAEFAVIIVSVKANEPLVGGYEFELLILAAALALVFIGSGVYGVDQVFNISLY